MEAAGRSVTEAGGVSERTADEQAVNRIDPIREKMIDLCISAGLYQWGISGTYSAMLDCAIRGGDLVGATHEHAN